MANPELPAPITETFMNVPADPDVRGCIRKANMAVIKKFIFKKGCSQLKRGCCHALKLMG
jgi:hypothetical protein